MSTTGPKTITPPDGHDRFIAELGELLDGGASIPCTGPSWEDWTADGDLKATRAAVSACPALAACRTYAVHAVERTGVWGGTTPQERAQAERTRHRINLRRAAA